MYVAFIFVFFFKQQTAYERRISDWSSDVCSSDLVSTVSPVLTPSEIKACAIFVESESICEYVYNSPLKSSSILSGCLATARSNASIKIGSASCRERVCQYV